MERIQSLLDPDTFVEMDADLSPSMCCGSREWPRTRTVSRNIMRALGSLTPSSPGMVILDGYKVAIAVMDFGFLAATMGSVVGREDYPDH